MGRHGGGKRSVNLTFALTVALALVAIIGLSGWWWSLRTVDDPVAADPVSAYGTIVTSDPCAKAGAGSTVKFSTSDGIVTAPVPVCGFKPEQPLLVEYLRSDPQQVRPAGTSPQSSSTARKLLPIGILAFGVIGAGALLALVRDRRNHRRSAGEAPSWIEIRNAALAQEAAAAGGLEPKATAPPVPTGPVSAPFATTQSDVDPEPPSATVVERAASVDLFGSGGDRNPTG